MIGQQHITKTLKTSLKNNNHSHAYLLTGPRGVGKTSVARILAHEINSLPYTSEQPPIDIIEIDAASNRRIDEIRDIKEKAFVAPVQAKYKVYIIDEVHMLTKESFNALLKTLEEPPKHVIFILATTELYKLPETIISRCIHFPFKPIGKPDLIQHLKMIARSEKISIDDDALELIADHGRGSFRDSISLLDQVRSLGAKLTAHDVEHALGLAPQDLIAKLAGAVSSRDIKSLTNLFESLYEFGADPVIASKQLLQYIRAGLLANKPLLSASRSVDLMSKLLDTASSADPKKEIELALIGAIVSQPEYGSKPVQKPQNQRRQAAPATIKNSAPPSKQIPGKPDVSGLKTWEQTLDELKKTNNTLYAIARMAECHVDGGELVLEFEFAFHQKQMFQPKNLSAITDVVKTVSKGKHKLKINQPEGRANGKPAKSTSVKHKNISNIFGGSEVLES